MNPNINFIKNRNQNHEKANIYSMEYEISNLKYKMFNIKRQIGNKKYEVENIVSSMVCQVRSVESKYVKYKKINIKCRV